MQTVMFREHEDDAVYAPLQRLDSSKVDRTDA